MQEVGQRGKMEENSCMKTIVKLASVTFDSIKCFDKIMRKKRRIGRGISGRGEDAKEKKEKEKIKTKGRRQRDSGVLSTVGSTLDNIFNSIF